ncbi:MAG: PIG-L family deacetylase [Chloroflexota bacterium]|nr:MAG: PIG-L family deacetylase [Chloroflexota bacterium]
MSKRAMAIVAHCDDIEFGCAGTIATWVRDGYEVMYVICTDSSKGSEDPNIGRDQLVELREAEQRASAKIVGVSEIVFLPYADGDLRDDDSLRRDLCRLIRSWKPERVITFDPSMRWSPGGYVNHPDHIAVGNAALTAVYPFARNRPTYPELLAEGLEPFTVSELWMYSFGDPNRWVDISSTIDLKIAALRAHASQMKTWDPEPMVRAWAKRGGAGQLIDAAETFRVLKLD